MSCNLACWLVTGLDGIGFTLYAREKNSTTLVAQERSLHLTSFVVDDLLGYSDRLILIGGIQNISFNMPLCSFQSLHRVGQTKVIAKGYRRPVHLYALGLQVL